MLYIIYTLNLIQNEFFFHVANQYYLYILYIYIYIYIYTHIYTYAELWVKDVTCYGKSAVPSWRTL